MTTDPELPLLQIRTDVNADDRTILGVRGEIDLSTAPELESRLREAFERGVPIIVDLSGTDYMDSSGFRILHRAAARGALTLVVPPEGLLRRVVGLAGLGEVMRICDSLSSANDDLASGPQ
jgi:anti-sigma B factor antagonist